jgi:ubiquinone/menaquinone biosynthesis C-methylase UbiE
MDDEEERVRSVYDRYGRSARRARAWSAANPGNLLIREEVVTATRARVEGLEAPPGDILDVGCGSGWWLRRLAEIGVPLGRLHGVDLLESRVGTVQGALPEAHIARADARALPFPDDRFWLVTMFLVLSSQDSTDSQLRSLREAKRVARPGGHIVVWEPRVPNPANRATRLVRLKTLRAALGPDISAQPVTVLPLLTRRLGDSPAAYRRLARLRLARTHRLVHARS